MALTAHTIVSRYTPQQLEPITRSASTEGDPWETESSFGPALRLHSRPAPYFVAATLKYDEYGMPISDTIVRPGASQRDIAAADPSTWYRSLTSKSCLSQGDEYRRPPSTALTLPSSPARSHGTTLEHQPVPSEAQLTLSSRKTIDWFTSRTADVSSLSAKQQVSKPSAFADLFSRNPLPRSSEPAFKPPVFLTLGPSNKGFTMLQRKGWQEGEGLGSARIEATTSEGSVGKGNTDSHVQQVFNTKGLKHVKRSVRAPDCGTIYLIEDEIPDVIDLTLSDPEIHRAQEVVDLTLDLQSELDLGSEDGDEQSEAGGHSKSQPHGITLLTPISTTLKADRLGIGLKVKRRPSRAITHTSSALAAHIHCAKRMRKEKARYGRGSRGFARSKMKEKDERVQMLAYMNT